MSTPFLPSMIADATLSPQGKHKIDWVQAHMPVLRRLHAQYVQQQPFAGLTVAISLHLEAKTAYLGLVLQAGGAHVVMAGSNPLSTQDDVCAALVAQGVTVYARYNPTPEEYEQYLHKTLDTHPDLLIDDGGDLVHLLHTTRQDALSRIRGGAEETTTGIMRLHALVRTGQLRFPMVAVNDAQCKFLFDNRYGTGQSVFDGINRTTNLVVAGKTVVVVGYGWCGKGVALRAKGLGAQVIVTEIDPIKAVEAYMDGFTVMPMHEAARQGDTFVTVTGNRDVIDEPHFLQMKDGAILCNAGHFDIEINMAQLRMIATRIETVRPHIEQFSLPNGRTLYVLAEGRLVNLAAGDGHPAEIMDMTFALQALALEHIVQHTGTLPATVLPVPRTCDVYVAQCKLEALGIAIDTLTPQQQAYYAGTHT